jgi:uncharacterized protein (TIRG00374 family)
MLENRAAMNRYRKQVFAGLLIAGALYIAVLLLADTQGDLQSGEIVDAIQRFPLELVIPILLCQIMVIVFRFLSWHYYLGVIGAREKISLHHSAVIQVSMFTMVVSPGKAAELLKSFLLRVKTGVPIAQSAPIVLAERIMDGLAVIILMVFALMMFGDTIPSGAQSGIDYGNLSRLLVYSSATVILVGLVVVQIKPLSYFFLNLLRKIPFVRRAYTPLVAFYESSREIFHVRHVIPMVVVGVGVYLFSVLGFLVLLYGFGLTIDERSMLQAMFIVGFVSAVGALSFVPNGAGITEVSNTGMMIALMTPTQPLLTPVIAAAAALMQGFFHKWFRVLVGMLVAFVYRDVLFTAQLDQVVQEYESVTPET